VTTSSENRVLAGRGGVEYCGGSITTTSRPPAAQNAASPLPRGTKFFSTLRKRLRGDQGGLRPDDHFPRT
jgi:hypothetical protein